MSQRPRRRPAPQARQRSHRPRLRNQLLFVAGILILASGAFYTALVVATQINQIFFPGTSLGGLPSLPGINRGEEEDIGGGRINVLVLGLDRRPREGDAATRTDTMFVMTIDPGSGTARGLAMPRDLWVDIPSKTGNSAFKQRINAAYPIGESQDYPGGGAGLTRRVVEDLLDIEIDYYVVIDFEGFKKIIDLLGGIKVEVDEELAVHDPYYSETELLGDYYPCIFPPGIYQMNGSQALCFARTRRNDNDFARILRQQRIISAVADKASELNLLANADNIVSLYKRYKNAIKTDVSDLQAVGFAKLASRIDPKQMAFLSLAPTVTPWTTPDGASVLLPSEAGIKQLVEAFVADSRLQEEKARVELRNGTGLEGQATKAADFLTRLGIPKDSFYMVNNATRESQTQIISFNGKTYTAERIAALLEIPKNRVRQATPNDAALRSSDADIVVILGTDAKLESAVATP
jgi:LCP family protein required for cell wall assembly